MSLLNWFDELADEMLVIPKETKGIPTGVKIVEQTDKSRSYIEHNYLYDETYSTTHCELSYAHDGSEVYNPIYLKDERRTSDSEAFWEGATKRQIEDRIGADVVDHYGLSRIKDVAKNYYNRKKDALGNRTFDQSPDTRNYNLSELTEHDVTSLIEWELEEGSYSILDPSKRGTGGVTRGIDHYEHKFEIPDTRYMFCYNNADEVAVFHVDTIITRKAYDSEFLETNPVVAKMVEERQKVSHRWRQVKARDGKYVELTVEHDAGTLLRGNTTLRKLYNHFTGGKELNIKWNVKKIRR
jgi:hypothetical protein